MDSSIIMKVLNNNNSKHLLRQPASYYGCTVDRSPSLIIGQRPYNANNYPHTVSAISAM